MKIKKLNSICYLILDVTGLIYMTAAIAYIYYITVNYLIIF